MSAEFFDAALDVAFNILGVEATYTGPDGVTTGTILVIPSEREGTATYRTADLIVNGGKFKVRAADCTPERDGGFTLADGSTFLVIGDPMRADPRRLVWTCQVQGDE